MHELSLAGAVVDTVVKHAGDRTVSTVRLDVGDMRQVVPDSLDFYFGFVSRDTVCEGADLQQNVIPVRLRCPSCEREWGPEDPVFRCSDCEGVPATVLSGEEFEVVSIVVSEGQGVA